MSPSLETKLAQIVNHFERIEFGSVLRNSSDPVGIRHLLNDPEVSRWLDCKRLEGIPNGPLINKG